MIGKVYEHADRVRVNASDVSTLHQKTGTVEIGDRHGAQVLMDANDCLYWIPNGELELISK